MSKRNKIIYWIVTVWLSFGMSYAGILQILREDVEIKLFESIQSPLYLLPFLGAMKILGVIAILIPKFPILKEWAYAGFFFTALGAAYSHVATGHTIAETAPLLLFFALIITSWYFRPADRKATSVKPA